MRASLHIGLAILLVLAPAFCCCNTRLITDIAVASTVPACPSCPIKVAASVTPQPSPCCHTAQKQTPEAEPQPKPAPNAPVQSCCSCLAERPDAVPPEQILAESNLEQTSGFLLVLYHIPAAIPPEHLGLLGGLDPPERAGVDARYEALFSRHVMRC